MRRGTVMREKWFFWRMRMKSKLLRLRCVLLGGHVPLWTQLHGGGAGYDALFCMRCRCHVAEYRTSEPPATGDKS